MIRTFLGILALQIVFGLLLAGAIFMGKKADDLCKPPRAWVTDKAAPPWAPTRRCETR